MPTDRGVRFRSDTFQSERRYFSIRMRDTFGPEYAAIGPTEPDSRRDKGGELALRFISQPSTAR